MDSTRSADYAVPPPEGRRSEFFHLVPPTPHGCSGQAQADNASLEPQSQDQSRDENQSQRGYHLRPARWSHRSISSSGSFDARTEWSTVGSDPSSEGEGEPSDHPTGAEPPHKGGSGQGRHSGDAGQTKPHSLSIDPKVFQPKHRATPLSTTGSKRASAADLQPSDEEAEVVDPLPTAKPGGTKLKSPKKTDKKKVSHARKQGPEHIPRPRNAFILFRKHIVDSKLIPPSVEMRHQNVSVIVAKMWSEAPPDQKAHFNHLAKIEKEEHAKKYPGYRYQPVYRRTNVIRRRVRKDDAEEEKCRSVAELLLKGKSGEALEQEINDKIHKANTANRKGSSGGPGANELSKGALRALRAQARHQSTPSIDWSEFGSSDPSRANSLEADAYSLGGGSREAGQATIGGYRAQGDLPYASVDSETLYDGFDWSSGFGGNGSGQPAKVQQTYAYPQEETSRSGRFSYPQPRPSAADMPIAADFYASDQALPFSPNAAASFAMQMTAPALAVAHSDNLPTLSVDTEQMGGGNDLLLNMPYPSPTSGLYGTGPVRLHPVPMSARWDRTHHLLPPSSELALDGLGFEGFDGSVMGRLDDDLLLQDFGAALAQTDEAVW